MDEVILDTSIVVKWFSDEIDSQAARNLLEKHKKRTIKIIIPEIVALEVVNSLSLGAKFTAAYTNDALEDLYSLEIEMIPLSQKLLQKTLTLVDKYKIAAYDALFLALAQQRQIPLITADRKHHLKEYCPLVQYLS